MPPVDYSRPLTKGEGWLVSNLMAAFGYDYQQARSFPFPLANWFLEFYQKVTVRDLDRL